MLNCKQVTRLVSQAMDAKLPWYQRLGIRFHLLYCVWCRRYIAQLRFLQRAAREMAGESADFSDSNLSGEAKAQMRKRLQDALKNPPSSPR
jgi:hypothetical protein